MNKEKISAKLRATAVGLDPKVFAEERKSLVKIANKLVEAQDYMGESLDYASPFAPPPES